jgi:hypothetical protein
MIHDLWLRWVVTGLLVLSAAEWAYVIVTRRRAWTFVVSYVLHLVMAIAMAVMAWPWGTHLPTTGPAVFFLVAAVWFVTMTIVWARTVSRRALRAYHALMMLAMAWMYAVLNGHILPGQSGGGQRAEAPGTPMPGMDMGATDMNMTASSESPGWITAGNWFWLVGFAVAAVVWTYIVAAKQRKPANKRWPGLLYGTSQAMMAAGMAIMFSSMLFQV